MANYGSGSMGAQVNNTTRPVSDLEWYEKELRRIDKRKSLLIKAIEQHKTSIFKVGDPAVLPEIGIVLISEVQVPAAIELREEANFGGSSTLCKPVNANNDKISDIKKETHYVICTPLIFDNPLIAESKLLPLNSASKTLYGKK